MRWFDCFRFSRIMQVNAQAICRTLNSMRWPALSRIPAPAGAYLPKGASPPHRSVSPAIQ
jgi:hypothetical protein